MKIIRENTVYVSEKPASEYRWGYVQFPKLFRLDEKRILLTVSNNLDLAFLKNLNGYQPLFLSEDNGKTFKDVTGRNDEFPEDIRMFSAYTDEGLLFFPRENPTDMSVYGLSPVISGVRTSYGDELTSAEYCIYDYESLPESLKGFRTVLDTGSRRTEWFAKVRGLGTMSAMTSEYDYVKKERKYLNPMLFPLSLTGNSLTKGEISPLLISNDGWYIVFSEPIPKPDRVMRNRLRVFKSTDGGKNYDAVSVIEPDDRITLGLSCEYAINETKDGRLVLLDRLCLNHDMKYPHYLAEYISDDRGKTWRELDPVSQSSVTPWLIKGNKELVAVYGRPGVYLKSTEDGINWDESTTLLGMKDTDVPSPTPMDFWNEHHHKYSCGNTMVLKLCENRYLVTYSDFMYPKDGIYHKAIKTAEIEVS